MRENSNLQTIMFLVKGNVACGALALPYYFSLLGPIYSIPMTVLVGGCCIYNMWLLANIRKQLSIVYPQRNIQTYGDISFVILGKYGYMLQQTLLGFLQLAVCCIYVSFVANNILSLLPTHHDHTSSTGTEDTRVSRMQLRAIMCGLSIPLFLLVHNLRTIRQLSVVSILSCSLLGIGMFVIICFCVARLMGNNYAILKSSVALAIGNSESGGGFLLKDMKMSDVSLFVASVAYSYEGIGVALPIENAMQDRAAFGRCLFIAMGIVSLIFILFAEICSLAFESLIHEGSMVKFLQMYYNDNSYGQEKQTEQLIMTIVNIIISIAILLSYPMQLFPAVEVLEQCVISFLIPTGAEGLQYHSVHVGGDIELQSDLGVHVIGKRARTESKSGSGSGNGTYQHQQEQGQIIITPFHKDSCTSDPNDINIPYPSAEPTLAYPMDEVICCGLSTATWCRIVSIGLTIIIPMVIPYVVFLIPIAGASTGALLAMIIAPVMDYAITIKANKRAMNCSTSLTDGSSNDIQHLMKYQTLRLVLNIVSIFLGIFCAIFGTVYACQELVAYFRSKSSV